MDVEKVVEHFGGTYETCKALNVTKGAISQWRSDGIPELRQFQIETLTKGKFKADRQQQRVS